jgi:hypothetical protein
MNTLLDFLAFTKSVEYLIAIAFIIGFSIFWIVLYGERKGMAIKVGLLSYLLLGFILMVGSCLSARP